MAPPIIALHRTWLVSASLPCDFGAQVGVSYFPVRHSARIHGDHFVSFPDSYVSLPRISHRVLFLGHLTRRVTGLTFCPPPRSSRILSFALLCSPDSLILMHPAIDLVWRCPCLPRLRLLRPLAVAVRLVVFRPGWLLTFSLTGSSVEPSCLGRLLCFEAGLTYCPLLTLPGLC